MHRSANCTKKAVKKINKIFEGAVSGKVQQPTASISFVRLRLCPKISFQGQTNVCAHLSIRLDRWTRVKRVWEGLT